MTSRAQVWSLAGLVALMAVATAIYTSALETSPPYLMHDELQFSLQARSIASTGYDLAGRRLPVFFTEPEFAPGRDPVIVYVTAAVLTVVPFSERGARLPTALVGLANIALMFFAARALSGDARLGLLAALLLAFTPIHFIRARLVLSPFYSIPFILGWLIALAAYLRSGSRRALLAGTALVALSVYTYLACTVMAPLYFMMTWSVAARREGRKVLVPMAITAAIVLTPLLIWSAMHPERYAQLVEAYRLYGSTADSTPLVAANPDGPRGLRLWIGLVWRFLNPDFLFLSGDSSLVNSTRQAGFFPMAFAVLLPVGLHWIWKSGQSFWWIVGLGFLTAPLASIISGALEMNRIMFAIPFGVLVASAGALALVAAGNAARVAAVILIASVPLQFAGFHADYLGDYRTRSASWFGGNIRAAMRYVIDAAPGNPTPVFISARIPFAGRYWRFYSIDGGRPDLISVPTYYVGPPVNSPVGSHLICQSAEPECQRLGSSGLWRRVSTAVELDQAAAFDVLVRQPGP